MRITKLNIISFGGIKDKTIELKNGINVIYGENEAGKSTICAFVEAMLYGMNKPAKNENRIDIRSKYIPWDMSSASGSIEFSFNNEDYVLERKFGKTKRADKATLRFQKNWEECFQYDADCIGKDILGLSEESFVKSVFIGQLQTKISGKDDEILKKLSNLSSTGDEEASFSSIENILQNAKYAIIPKATAKSIMGDLINKKEALLREEQEIEISNESLKDRIAELNIVSQEAEELTCKINALTTEKESAREYEKFLQDKKVQENIDNLLLRLKENNNKSEILKAELDKIHSGIKEHNISALNEALTELDLIKNDADEIKINQVKLSAEREKVENLADLLKTEKNKSKKISSVILLVSGIFFALIGIACRFLIKEIFKANVLLVLLSLFFTVSLVLIIFSVLAFTASEKYKKRAINTQKRLYETEENIKNLIRMNETSENQRKKDEILQKINAKSVEDIKKQIDVYAKLEKKAEILNNELSFLEKSSSQIETDINLAKGMLIGVKKCEKTRSFDEVDKELTDKNNELGELVKRKKEIEFSIKHKGEGLRTLDIVRSELMALNPEIEYYNSVHSSLEIALSVIKECEEELKSGFSPELNKTVNKILGFLTDNKYNEIKLSDDYNVFVKTSESSEIVNANALSGGTYDLIYFAVRLGILKNIFGEKIPLLILDDTFLQLDDERQRYCVKYLSEMTELMQACYFTCHNDVLYKFTNIGNVNVINI